MDQPNKARDLERNITQFARYAELVPKQNISPDHSVVSSNDQALMEDSKEEVMEFRDEELLVAGDDMDANTPKETKESS
ncbi:hypothetical protein Tco_0009117 [Tanacetum coccineum]